MTAFVKRITFKIVELQKSLVYETIWMEWVMITPFLNEKDYENIDKKIQRIHLRKKKARLKQHLMQISNPEFFCKNLKLDNKQDAIQFMIMWDDHLVNIVLLLAVNKEERAIFHDVYDNLIVLLLEKANASKVIESSTYIEFIEAVVGCVE